MEAANRGVQNVGAPSVAYNIEIFARADRRRGPHRGPRCVRPGRGGAAGDRGTRAPASARSRPASASRLTVSGCGGPASVVPCSPGARPRCLSQLIDRQRAPARHPTRACSTAGVTDAGSDRCRVNHSVVSLVARWTGPKCSKAHVAPGDDDEIGRTVQPLPDREPMIQILRVSVDDQQHRGGDRLKRHGAEVLAPAPRDDSADLLTELARGD